jgi:D-alanyl-D-alanine carboxypeptidase (penicillin-binding protein 5/6)
LLAATLTIAGLLAAATPAAAAPPAPRPTSTALSPEAPDPHPPRGGLAPDGSAVGGARLLSRGVVVPAHAPALPTGLTAQAWVLSDLDTGEILAARDAHGRYQPASILKILTSLVLLPKLPGRRIITASATAANTEGSAVGLVAGGKYRIDTLFQSLLLMSGNDAATALAEAAGGVPATVAAMNAEAVRLGAYDTYVQTPSGLDGWQQLTSAYDLSLFLRAAVDTPRLLAYDRTPTATLPAEKVGTQSWGPVPLYNQSQNFFDGVPGALLAKTGYTDAALHTYMCAATRNGRRLGVVFLRAQRAPTDQWQQAATLLDWGFHLSAGRSVGDLAGTVTPTPSSSASSGSPASASPTATPTSAAGAAGLAAGPHPGRGDGLSTLAIVNTALLAVLALVVALRVRRVYRRRRAAH